MTELISPRLKRYIVYIEKPCAVRGYVCKNGDDVTPEFDLHCLFHSRKAALQSVDNCMWHQQHGIAYWFGRLTRDDFRVQEVDVCLDVGKHHQVVAQTNHPRWQ